MDSPYIDTRNAAAYLNLSPRTLEKKRIDGTGPPFVKFGRRVLYDLNDLKSWAVALKRRSTSDSA